jgi:DNA-binding NarL/FixJ family response regulator
MIHVALVAPAPALRAGLRALLSGDESLQIVAEAAALAEAAPLPAEVDVLILALPETATADLELALRSIEHGAVLFLVENPHEVTPLLDSPLRAWGALSWEASTEELQAAVHAVHQGLWVGSPQVFQPLLARGASVEASNPEPMAEALTARESEVLQMLAQGLPNKQIALALNISEHTVKFHISSIYSKLGATNRAEAIRQGARRGLIVF